MLALHSVKWTEYERGWGSRPDGISFYSSRDLAEEHVGKNLANRSKTVVPDDYSDPGEITIMEVSQDLYDLVHRRGMVWMTFNTEKAAKEYVFDPRHDPPEPPTVDDYAQEAMAHLEDISASDREKVLEAIRNNPDAFISFAEACRA